MPKVTENAVREMIREIFTNSNYGVLPSFQDKSPVVVNPIIDPSKSDTDPEDPRFNPQDNKELSIALNHVARDIPEDQIGSFYFSVKKIVDDLLGSSKEIKDFDTISKTDTGNPNRRKEMTQENKNLEEMLRKEIRSIIKEMADDQGEKPAEAPPEPEKGKKSRLGHGAKTSSMGKSGMELMPFKEIAKQMTEFLNLEKPISVSGAKQMVDKAWRKARFIDEMFKTPEQKQKYLMDLILQYIQWLDTSDELSIEDYDFMRDVADENPGLIFDLESFQQFMLEDLKDAGFHPDLEVPWTGSRGFDFKGNVKKSDTDW